MKSKLIFISLSLLLHALALAALAPWHQTVRANEGMVSVEIWNSSEVSKSSQPAASRRASLAARNVLRESGRSQTASIEAPSLTHSQPAASAPAVSGDALGIHVSYPRLSRLMGEEGRVVVRVGNDPQIISSSGHPRLDRSVIDAVREALKKDQSLQRDQDLAFLFRLTE